ncbi:MAG TPA: rRNA small subunit methyltransferase 1, partial [Kiritimatiellia bacterium]|nr:rRNA small subunit methyltransferase 1 [Kiritimatiellia bacterium]
ATLRGVGLVLAEDTRMTKRLLDRYGIRVPMWSCHKFSEASRLGPVLDRIRGGEAVGLVSDSGMPGISDPGARVVEAVREAGLPVTCAPGPTALTTAVALAGLDETGFLFGGFPPVKPGRRRRVLEELLGPGFPVVVYESPYRVVKLLRDLEGMDALMQVFVGRELTKKFEQTGWNTAQGWREHFERQEPRGEFVLIFRRGAGATREHEDRDEGMD